ncbi:Rik1-associated factor 1-like protein [Cladobotryum mycophilum]|uniref:Target of rapamycin complex subunit LST8 n=1 Tax=Cladobotryum mycophilum TaxID=491253 RepID=A0ABR0T1D3_9HYPO
MSLALTTSVTRPLVIDLTESPSSSPSIPTPTRLILSNGAPRPHELPVPHDEGPVLKKRRMNQVLPHVSRAVKALSAREYKMEDIAVQALASFIGDSTSDLALYVEDERAAALRAESIVRNLASLPRYQLQSARALTSDVSFIDTTLYSSTLAVATAAPPRPAVSPPASILKRPSCFQQRNKPLVWKRPLNTPDVASLNPWFKLQARPYQTAIDRQRIARGTESLSRSQKLQVPEPTVYHVDFTPDEVANIIANVSKYLSEKVPSTIESLTRLSHQYNIPTLVGDSIPHRTTEDVRNFCTDLLAGNATDSNQGRILTLEQNADDSVRKESKRMGRMASLLLAREIEGNRGFGKMRRYENFQNEFRKTLEDDLTLIAEFTNCAGDIATTTWVPDNNVICGTTNHSDTHNQQYNKPGNLLLCSASRGELRAFPDHRIPRPIVEKGENSTEAMRQSQDPWLYSSVVSSDYDTVSELAYTSGFDRTVKVWKVCKTGESMTALATWHLEGNVNFVSVTKDGSGRVATAADVPSEAVRIYTVKRDDIANSPYVSFSCSRTDADGSDKWAYFPATMQWGRSPGTHNILAVGYSPRSLTGDDHDIPEDKRGSGEVTLWDADKGCRLSVTTATTSNFFEIVWHPTLPCFVAATTPVGLKVDYGVRTQIHLFRRDNNRQDGGYQEYQNLDCYAADINELTFMPNSPRHAYVTAGCTDGNVYVWDTAQGDKPIHVLKHGHPVDDFHEDREKEDTGVKFTAWGITPDRFYTGSSDGVVKVWNVRNQRKPFVRDLVVAPGPISCGAFSPDSSKLVIGDATGRVFVFSLDKRDASEKHYTTLPLSGRRIRRPIPYISHPEPPPPERDTDRDAMDVDDADTSIAAIARSTYLDTKQLLLHPNPVIGAIQGPNYISTNLFRFDAHLNNDPTAPLLPSYERQQRESIASSRGTRSRSLRRLRTPGLPDKSLTFRHETNKGLDFDVSMLEDGELESLLRAGAELRVDDDEDWGFRYEEVLEDDA